MMLSLRPFCENDLDIVLKWRNSERIRKNMYNDKVITLDEHTKWFNQILENNPESYLMFLVNNVPRGIVCFTQINPAHKHCFWGFYIGDSNSPKGSGTILGLLGLDYAFKTFQLLKINGEVLNFNNESIKFHEKFGFIKEGVFEKHVLKENKSVDVIRFALFKSDWEIHKNKIIADMRDKGFHAKNHIIFSE